MNTSANSTHEVPKDDFALPELTARLVAAGAAGNLDLVRTILAEWQAVDEPEPPRGDDEQPMCFLQPALAAAAGGDHLDVLAHLLKDGFQPDDAAIRAAIDAPSIGALELFLHHGWDINRPERKGRPPPLSRAVGTDNEALIRWFLAHGADANAHGRILAETPLSYAARGASLATVRLLLEAGGGDARRGSALHGAVAGAGARPQRLALVDLLLAAGAPIDGLRCADHPAAFKTWGPRGLGTPLHTAVKTGNRDMVVALLARGADRGVKDSRGQTPLEVAETEAAQVPEAAAREEARKIVELLRDG